MKNIGVEYRVGSYTDSELHLESSQPSSGGDCPERLGRPL